MSDDLVKRLRNTPNWMREGFQDWKDNVRTYDRAPFEAADRIEEMEAKLRRVVDAGVRVRDYFTHHSNDDVYAVHDFDEAIAYLKGQNDEWKCPINHPNCEENCGNYGCGN